MTWSIQLTPWALPLLLAVLLVLRDVGYLWPRRREGATPPLLVLAASAGIWASLQLLVVVTPALTPKVLFTRLAYLPAAVAPVAWVWFALSFAGGDRPRSRWGRRLLVALYALSAVTVLFALAPPTAHLLFSRPALEHQGASPLFGLVFRHGGWHWGFVAVRVVAVVVATEVIAGRLAHAGGARPRILWAVGAALLALAPAAFHLSFGRGTAWTDLSAAGFAAAAAFLTGGILYPRLLDLGPVARTLVMVELRDPIVVLDGKGHIVDANRAARTLLGLRPYGDVPLALGKLWARSRAEAGDTGSVTISLPVSGDGGGERPFDVTITPLGDRGSAVRSAMVLRDVTARVEMERDLRDMADELERLANSDHLTGLANRRHFIEALDREVERSDRYARPLSLVLLDLDHFKKVNDTWGHAAGDEVLRDAARAMRAVCREIDLPARLGGEEMVILLPETDAEGARVVAERVRANIRESGHVGGEGRPFHVTASVGVATRGPRAATGEALLQRADEALYAAKRGGRNRVVVAS